MTDLRGGLVPFQRSRYDTNLFSPFFFLAALSKCPTVSPSLDKHQGLLHRHTADNHQISFASQASTVYCERFYQCCDFDNRVTVQTSRRKRRKRF